MFFVLFAFFVESAQIREDRDTPFITLHCHLGVYGPSLGHLTHVHPPSHLGVCVALLGHTKEIGRAHV